MAQYIIRRLLALIPVLIGVSIVVFLLIRMIPGDPVVVMLGEKARLEDVERVRHEMGFDRPIYIQYIEWMGRILRGDLGKSILGYTPVIDELKYRLPATIEMVLLGLFMGVLFGVGIGIISALKQNTWVDTSAMFVALIGVSMPIYWLALMLIYALAVNNRIFPPSQRLDVEFIVIRRTGFMLLDTLMMGDIRMFANAVWHLILPSIVLSTVVMPILARLTRSSMLGGHAPGLRAHRARQGAGRERHHHSPCTQERLAAGRHGDRPATRRFVGRRAAHRDDLLLARHGLLDLPRHPEPRLSDCAGRCTGRARRSTFSSICSWTFRTRISIRASGTGDVVRLVDW